MKPTQESCLVHAPPPLALSLSPPSNLCGLPDDGADFTWAQAINALTLDFNQAICLRAGTASAARADSVKEPRSVREAGTRPLSASRPPPARSTRLFFTTQGLCLNCCDELLQSHHLQFSFLPRPLSPAQIYHLSQISAGVHPQPCFKCLASSPTWPKKKEKEKKSHHISRPHAVLSHTHTFIP